MRVSELRKRAKKRGFQGYSQLRKDELIDLLFNQKIPKVYHQIWIGSKPLPEYYKLYRKSFKKYLPNYKYKLWRNKDITKENFPLTYKYIQKSNVYAQISDLMRLEILYWHGGYYFDTTFELKKPLDPLFSKTPQTFVACNEVKQEDVGYLSNAFIGAIPKHPVLVRLLSKKKLDRIDFSSEWVDTTTGPWYLKSGIRKGDDVKIYPTLYFYPYVCWENPYRAPTRDKCLWRKRPKGKRNIYQITLKGKTAYLQYPCPHYSRSYAIKHFALGGSWLKS